MKGPGFPFWIPHVFKVPGLLKPLWNPTGYPPVAMQTTGGGRVLEIDPVKKEIVWAYTGLDSDRAAWTLYSSFISNAERLPNCDSFIDEGMNGRLFQVTSTDEIVWEYVNPHFTYVGNTRGYAKTRTAPARRKSRRMSAADVEDRIEIIRRRPSRLIVVPVGRHVARYIASAGKRDKPGSGELALQAQTVGLDHQVTQNCGEAGAKFPPGHVCLHQKLALRAS
jgi:hypothetical protein